MSKLFFKDIIKFKRNPTLDKVERPKLEPIVPTKIKPTL